MTSRWDDEVVDIKDGEDKEVSEGETLALRVTQGDGSMQLEGLMEDRTDLAHPFPLSPLNASCFFFFCFFYAIFIPIQEQGGCLVLANIILFKFLFEAIVGFFANIFV